MIHTPHTTRYALHAGFTLIETILYAVIVSMFIGSVVIALYAMLETDTTIGSKTELNDNAQYIYQKFAWALKGADTVDAPAPGSKGPLLLLFKKINSIPTQMTFSLQNGSLVLQRGPSGPVVPLTNAFVRVASLGFETYSFATESRETVRIKTTLVSTDIQHPATSSLDFFIGIQ